MSSVSARLDGSILIVRIPMRLQRCGGRKRIVVPDGSELAPRSKPQPDGTLVKALARAWRWQRMLDDGVYVSVSEIGGTENISKSYVSRICGWRCWHRTSWTRSSRAGRTSQSCLKGWSGRCRRAGRSSGEGSGSAVRTTADDRLGCFRRCTCAPPAS